MYCQFCGCLSRQTDEFRVEGVRRVFLGLYESTDGDAACDFPLPDPIGKPCVRVCTRDERVVADDQKWSCVSNL
ncbi:hypothetical protein Pla100_03120 [Neorhodopirellula pilleata]|uniref:Uncharacterized protein n=2 Tax=Neorhodopirellula pilleata TaxID=2714738 RepID=A0A5C6AVB9_9BACT|nr:hypothetical protein Pla100_03120 [Neorhodopirellula pilleata]